MNKTFAVFANGGTMTTTQTALWQYDYGQILVVQGIELPNAYEVQFCNAGDSTTITSVGDSTGVVIPDQFLQNGETIYAYIYLHTGNTDGETEYKITIPVMDRAEPTDIEPTPAQESTIGQLIYALNAGAEAAEEAAEKGPQIIDGYWHIWDAKAGEYVNTEIQAAGADGSGIWYTKARISGGENPFVRRRDLIGREGATVKVHDLLFAPDVGYEGEPTTLYEITSVGTACALNRLCKMQGEDGTSPSITITEITGGHRITITDEAHPEGQSFDVLDGQGGTVTVDSALSDSSENPVQNKIIKAALDGKYTKPSGGIPNSDLAEDAQRGYTSEEKATVFQEQTVTFEYFDPISFSSPLQPDPAIIGTEPKNSIVATFDGQTYVIPRYEGENAYPGSAIYGNDEDENFTDFPFHVYVFLKNGVIAENLDPVSGDASSIITYGDMTSGQHTFSAYFIRQPVTTTPDFDAAVAKSSAEALAGKLDADGDAYRAASLPMGHLDSTSTATVMTATIPGITELRDGVCVWLENGVIASASGVTLNINSLGAKPIYNSLSGAIVTTTFTAASTYLFVYNSTRVSGGCWDMVYGYDANTTYTPYSLGFGYGTCSTAFLTNPKVASVSSSYKLVAGGIVAIKFDNDVPANATLNINSKGTKAIYYRGRPIMANVIKAGDTVTMIYSTYYHVLSIDRDIPAPSDTAAEDVTSNFSSSGSSKEYARADHIHRLDASVFETILDEVSAINMPVILYDNNNNGVVIQQSPQTLMNIYQHQPKLNLALLVPPDYNNYPVIFTASSLNTTTGELHLTGIVGGVLYEATLRPGADPTGQSAGLCMVGTVTTTDLTLPSAQGVSF